jgi:ABC-type sugar transport system permease subunit
MDGLGKRYFVVAALVVALLGAAFALGVLRYGESGRQLRGSRFEALAAALQVATAVPDDGDDAALQALEREAGSLARGGTADRVFFVRKGKRIESLNISKPARVVVDLGRKGATGEEEEALITLSARLEKHFNEGGESAGLDFRILTWTLAGGRRVAAWPVVTGGEFQGVAGVELLAASPAPVRYREALLFVAAFVLLFGLGMLVVRREQLLFGLVSLLLLAGVVAAVYRTESAGTRAYVEARDAVATRFVNRTAWVDPGALRQLDALWTAVFKLPARDLAIAPLSEDVAGTGTALCVEGEGAVVRLALDRTWPVAVVVGLTLLLGLLLLPGLAELLRGLVTLPGVYAYVAPAMLGMVVLVLVPFVMGVGLGFFNTDYEFVGLENFTDILFPTAESQTNFYFTLGFTVLWTVSNVVLHVTIGLFMAMVLNNKQVRFRGLFRVLLIIPWAIPNYVTALIWKWMFTSQMGAINLTLEAIGLSPVNWFGPSFWTNFFAVLATNTWLGFPFMMVVSLGALQSIPGELYEAADIDGASRWQKFRHVTLPLLKPALFPAIILGTIWTFNMFNVIYLVTRGQPDNKTNILITEAYRFFAELNQYGVAAAYCVLIFIILLFYTLVTNRVTKATEGAFE